MAPNIPNFRSYYWFVVIAVWPQSEFLQWLSVTLSWSEGWLPVSVQPGGRMTARATQHCSGQLQTTVEPGTRHRTPHLTSHHHHIHTSLESFKCTFCEGYPDKKLSQRRHADGLSCFPVLLSSHHPTQHWVCVSVALHSWLNYEWRYKYTLTDNMSSSTNQVLALLTTHLTHFMLPKS